MVGRGGGGSRGGNVFPERGRRRRPRRRRPRRRLRPEADEEAQLQRHGGTARFSAILGNWGVCTSLGAPAVWLMFGVGAVEELGTNFGRAR